MITGLCRDCLQIHPALEPEQTAPRRCANCGSPRQLSHPELGELAIAHLDCDAFYAAVEKRDNPSLANQPVIIGGGRRGVVSTACYIARTYGVHSAQPMFKALKACPDATVIRPDIAKYSAIGREIRQMMRDLTPMVEPLSIDEAFLDLTGTERLHRQSAAESMVKLISRIEREVGITVSVGLSYCKFLAKIASDLDKPKGFSVIGRKEAVAFLAEQPVTLIWGVGKAFNKTLAKDGISKIGQLQSMDERTLAKRYGSMGLRLAQLSRGQDARNINPRAPMKSISHETTFNEDISDVDELEKVLWRLSENVSRRAKKADKAGETVTLKLKTPNFKIKTRNRTLPDPTQLAEKIFAIACELLEKEPGRTPYRLIGVGIAKLCDGSFADPPDLLDHEGAKHADAERAMDAVREKFGTEAIAKGRGLRK